MEILHRHGLGYCRICPTRNACGTLCTEAETYADQDYIPQRELLIGLPIADSLEDFAMSTEDEPEEPQYTPKEKAILMLLLNGYTIERICKLLEISRNTFRVHFFNAKRKS